MVIKKKVLEGTNKLTRPVVVLVFLLLTTASIAKETGKDNILLPQSTSFKISQDWEIKEICGRKFWNVIRTTFNSKDSWETCSLEVPFLREGIYGFHLYRNHSQFVNFFHEGEPGYEYLAKSNRPFMLRRFPRLTTSNDKVTYQKFTEKFGEKLLGIDGIAEWGMSFSKENGWWGGPDDIPKDREKAIQILEKWYKDHWFCPDVASLTGYPRYSHYAGEWGARSLFSEAGERAHNTSMQIAFLRGAARQYNKPWGLSFSHWIPSGTMTYYNKRAEGRNWITYETGPNVGAGKGVFVGEDAGHSNSLMRRIIFANYLSGANFYEDECTGFGTSQVIYKDGKLTPYGEAMTELYSIIQKYPDRGIPYTPVGVLIDYKHGFSLSHFPRRQHAFGLFPWTKGDWMINGFFSVIFPWHLNRERDYLINGPYGDIFDVLIPNPPSGIPEILDSYPCLALLGDIKITNELKQRLVKYVKNGGVLLINASQTGNLFPPKFLGLRLGEGKGADNTAICLLDSKTFICPNEFNYQKVSLLKAQPIFVTSNNEPLVTRNSYGKGTVIFTTPDYMLDAENKALPFLSHLLKHLFSPLLPFKVEGNIEYIINRTKDGWVVGLINNRGVYKVPALPVLIKQDEYSEVRITLPGKVKEVIEWMTGKKLRVRQETISLTVPAGDLRIVEIKER